MRKLLLICVFAIAYSSFALAQEQRMIYADLTMTKADTVSIDLTSTCAAYQKLVLRDMDGKHLRFLSLSKAINHLARYGWKVTARSDRTVTMEYPYSIAIVYGEQGFKDIENKLNEYKQYKR